MSAFAKPGAGPAGQTDSYVAIVLDITGESVISLQVAHAYYHFQYLYAVRLLEYYFPSLRAAEYFSLRVSVAVQCAAQVLWALRSKA